MAGTGELLISADINEETAEIAMNNAELINELRYCFATHITAIPWYVWCDRAADALEAAEKRIAELEAQMPKWISVEDRLPEESNEYIVYIQMGTGVEVPDWLGNGDLSYVTSMYFKKEQMLWFDEYDEPYNADLSLVDTVNDYHVTHWMPLQEAPKGE